VSTPARCKEVLTPPWHPGRPQVRLSLQRNAEVTLRLRCPNRVANSRPSGLGLVIYRQANRLLADHHSVDNSSNKRASANDGTYAYPTGGVVIQRALLEVGTYVCVASTFDPWNGPFELIAHAPDGALRMGLLPAAEAID